MFDEIDEGINGFMEDDAYVREKIPQAQKLDLITPASVILGVKDEVLENTVFTKIKMENTDFMSRPKKLPRLIFINKEKLLQNSDLVGGLSPLVLVLYKNTKHGLLTGCSIETNKKFNAIMCDNYLLLPMYPSDNHGFMPWGVDIAFRYMNHPAAGKLYVYDFQCDYLFILGKKYKFNGYKYFAGYFWNHYPMFKIKKFLVDSLMQHDLCENTTITKEITCS